MLDIRDFLKINHISLSRFINYCLYKKDQGFYQKNSIGTHFITSPEVSQLFGECVAIFFLLILKKYKVHTFFELGPGNGTLMKDLILRQIIISIKPHIQKFLLLGIAEEANHLLFGR